MKRPIFLLLFLAFPLLAEATSYFVTQSGSGTGTGLSLGNAWSVAQYNASTTPTGGDTVYFSGTITSQIAPNTGGTGTGASQLTVDLTAATLNITSSDPMIYPAGRNHVHYRGGGTIVSGTPTPGVTIGAQSGSSEGHPCVFDFKQTTTTDIQIDGFYWNNSPVTATARFINGEGANNITVSNNWIVNTSDFIFTDGSSSYSWDVANNYWLSSQNVTVQSDGIKIADGHDITIEGNFLENRSIGDNNTGRHNDVIQVYQGGGGSNAVPYQYTIRYNWIVTEGVQEGPLVTAGSFMTNAWYTISVVGTTDFTLIGAANNNVGTRFHATGPGSGTGTATASNTGDMSWLMIENMGNGIGTFALKVYGNVFVGYSDTVANNGASISGSNGAGSNGTFYVYNNTFIAPSGKPGNTWNCNPSTATLYTRNNIEYCNPSSGGTPVSLVMLVGATWGYNYFFGCGSVSSTIYGTGTGAQNTDPLFTSQSTADYSLTSSSPAKWTGDSTIGSTYSTGLAAGAVWPYPATIARSGGAWSIGAFEYASAGPTLSSATINTAGTILTANWSASCTNGAGGYGGVTITATNGAVTLSSPAGSGSSSYTWSTSRTIASSETVTFTYVQPGAGIQSTAGAVNVSSFSNSAVTNSSTQTTPTLSTATINSAGTSLSLGFSASQTTGASGNSGVTISASGGACSVTYSSGSGSSTYVYTLGRTINLGEVVTVTYTQPGAGIQNTTGAANLLSFSGTSVTNNSTQGSTVVIPNQAKLNGVFAGKSF